jgi:hypothetical protein
MWFVSFREDDIPRKYWLRLLMWSYRGWNVGFDSLIAHVYNFTEPLTFRFSEVTILKARINFIVVSLFINL